MHLDARLLGLSSWDSNELQHALFFFLSVRFLTLWCPWWSPFTQNWHSNLIIFRMAIACQEKAASIKGNKTSRITCQIHFPRSKLQSMLKRRQVRKQKIPLPSWYIKHVFILWNYFLFQGFGSETPFNFYVSLPFFC